MVEKVPKIGVSNIGLAKVVENSVSAAISVISPFPDESWNGQCCKPFTRRNNAENSAEIWSKFLVDITETEIFVECLHIAI